MIVTIAITATIATVVREGGYNNGAQIALNQGGQAGLNTRSSDARRGKATARSIRTTTRTLAHSNLEMNLCGAMRKVFTGYNNNDGYSQK